MAKIAFIGDVHGYAPALKKALDWCESSSIDQIVGLGDYVDGYDADEECVELVKQNFHICVQGNHDEDHSVFMHEDSGKWLQALPTKFELDDWLVTHSTPRQKFWGEYIRNSIEAWNCFDDCNFHRCIVGHAHQPMLYRYDSEKSLDSVALEFTNHVQSLDPNHRYLMVNPSLAYNRTGQQNPGFSVFDSESRQLQIVYLDMPQFKVKY